MNTYFTSDQHFGHRNILKYCSRPFFTADELKLLQEGGDFEVSDESLQQHDQTLLGNINSIVKEDDILYHLGDFAWGNYSVVKYYRDQIQCKNIILVIGNHDARNIRNLFSSVHEQLLVEVEGQKIFLNHYPMRAWNGSHRGNWHLFGHVHGNLKDDPLLLALDVGVDTHNFFPWSMDQLRAYMAPRMNKWLEWRNSWRDKTRGGMTPLPENLKK